MILSMACGVLAGLILSGPALAACQPKVIGSVPLKLTGSHYFIDAGLNGTGVTMLVDTGAQNTVVTSALVDRANLLRQADHYAYIRAVGGLSNPDGFAIIPDLRIGTFAAANLVAQIDGQDISASMFDAIIGANVLFKNDVEIDFPNRKLTFYAPSACHPAPADALPLPARRSDVSGLFLLGVALNGHPLRAILDTGSDGTMVTRDAALRAGASAAMLDRGASGGVRGANGETTPGRKFTFATFDIGRERFGNAPLPVIDTSLGEADMLVGLDYLRSRTILVSGGRLYISHSAPAVPALRTSQADTPEKQSHPR
jgi:predicted aspartyl protease